MILSNQHMVSCPEYPLPRRGRAHLCDTLRASLSRAALRAALRPYPISSDMGCARHCDAMALALRVHASLIAMVATARSGEIGLSLPSRSAEAPMLTRIGTVCVAPARPSRGRTLGLRSGSMAHAAIAASPRDRRNDARLAYAPQGSPALPGAPRNRLSADCLDARTCGGGR